MSDLILPNNKLIVDANTNKAIENNMIAKTYLDKRNKSILSEIPKIELLHNNVLVRAVQPFMEEFSGNVLVNRLNVSSQLAEKIDAMTYNVDDIQEILLIGNYISETKNNKILPGKFAKINFNRFKTVKAGRLQGHTDVIYEVPVVEFDGNKFLLIDSRDIDYLIDKENIDSKYYEPIEIK